MENNVLFPQENVTITKLFTVHQDWEVPIPGFFIITPLRKIRSICEFTREEEAEFITLLGRVRKGMHDILHISDVYLFQNEDSHHSFHLWMFPRHRWMERFGRGIESVRPIITYAKEHMITDDVFTEVKEYVKKMNGYMENSSPH